MNTFRKLLSPLVIVALAIPFLLRNPGIGYLQPLQQVHLEIHVCMFFLLGLVWATFVPRKMVLILPLFAAAIEVTQYWLPTRHFAFLDMGFNIVFSLSGYICYFLVIRYAVANKLNAAPYRIFVLCASAIITFSCLLCWWLLSAPIATVLLVLGLIFGGLTHGSCLALRPSALPAKTQKLEDSYYR